MFRWFVVDYEDGERGKGNSFEWRLMINLFPERFLQSFFLKAGRVASIHPGKGSSSVAQILPRKPTAPLGKAVSP